MNTAQEKPPENLGSLLEVDGKPDAKDETIASLNTEIQGLLDKLLEERFLWALACIVFIDMYVFSQMENWSGPVVVGVFQLVGVVIFADRCKVNAVAPLIDRLTGFAHRAAKTHGDPEAKA